MGRTLPSVTQQFYEEKEAFGRFRRALRRSDQRALDDLFAAAQNHLAAAAYAAHALPMEVFLLAMLLEEHKTVLRLRDTLDDVARLLEQAQDALPGESSEPDWDAYLPGGSGLPDGRGGDWPAPGDD